MSKSAATVKPTAAQEPKTHIVQKVIAGDTYLVMADSATQLDDEFSDLYFTTSSSSNLALTPPYEPKTLARLPNLNNILSQCIEAMEVNIDGTGHEFLPAVEGEKLDEEAVKVADAFFSEPYPGKSFLQIRRKLRRDLESVGYGYLEVLRTVTGEVAGLRNIDSHSVRMVKLDAPVLVTKTMMRNGKEVSMQINERERRYMQKIGGSSNKMLYFREFGSSRQLNKDTGEWAKELPANLRASELLAFGVNPDVGTPYSVPRWINQLPSVLGSRKAEEQNLEYFDAGGMPPAIIFVEGGTLGKSASEQLRGYLSGKAKNRQRAVVVEALSSSGSLDSSGGSVKVSVERFGAEQANDSMYQNYDKAAEDHIRTGFRLPPLFLGRANDYNYATAVVAYMVAEAQVFKPERMEFDDCITKNLLKALGLSQLKFVSKPITLKNIDSQLKSIEMLKGLVKEDDYVEEIAAIGGVGLVYDKATADETKAAAKEAAQAKQSQMVGPDGKPVQPANAKDAVAKPLGDNDSKKDKINPLSVVKSEDVTELAMKYAQLRGLLVRKMDFSPDDEKDIEASVEALHPSELDKFNRLIATWAFGSDEHADLAGCCH